VGTIIRSANATQTAVFGEIERVAEQERERLRSGDYEPAGVKSLRTQASDEARQVVWKACLEADAIREEARQEGYAAGLEEGRQAGFAEGNASADAERAAYRADVEALVALIEEERQRVWREAEPQIVAFVLEVAQKVVKDEAKINRDVAISTVRNALRRVVETDNIRIRVNPADLETVRAAREDLLSLVDGIRHVEIVEDRRMSEGGCVVETAGGTVDARLETQLAEIETALQNLAEEAA
jgi:flagellar assembly protein FliH